MKKITSILISIVMLISLTTPVLAAETESKEMERILLSVKERIGSTDDYDDFSSSVSSTDSSEFYRFNWSSSSGDDYKHLTVTANSDGIITYYYCNDDDDSFETRPTLNKMSSDEAMIKTEALIAKLNPDIAENITLSKQSASENLFDNGYRFLLQRTHCGVDVAGNSGYVSVNSDADAIVSFSLTYNQNLTFEPLENAISTEKAKESYKSNLGMKLQYNAVYKSAEGKTQLVYVPKYTDTYISALTGETITPAEPIYSANKMEMSADVAASAGGNGAFRELSEAELKNLEQLEDLISKDDAETAVRANKLLAVGSDMTLSYFNSFCDSVDENYTYYFDFSDENSSASVTVNANDGSIVNYSYYSYTEKTQNDITGNPDTAKSYIEQLAPKYYKSDDTLDYRFEKYDKNTYSFIRYANGIPCFNNTITLRLNADNSISYYNISYDNLVFDSPDGILSESEACDKLFENCEYELLYYPACSTDKLMTADTAILIYDTKSRNTTIDAKNGSLKNDFEEKSEVGDYSDIDGHYAENIIRTLAKFGIGFEESEFKPDSLITQEDYAVLLTSALIGNEAIILAKTDSNYSHYYRRAQSENIITAEEKDPSAPVSREMAAVYMIRALDLDEVAALDGIYISNFNDVTSHIGHISILNAMGVISGFGGSFNPKENLTRADAMIMLYNYLAR